MASLPESTLSIIQYLNKNEINPILYGSQGVSIYLGMFKEFSDIDLLVSSRLLEEEWGLLQDSMNKADYNLVDLHEHEFKNEAGLSVAFADEAILLRDGIIEDLNDLKTVNINGINIKTLGALAFKKAYEFSIKDGYRKDARGKNDEHIITLLEYYLREP